MQTVQSVDALARLYARSSALMIDREMRRLDALLTGLASAPVLKSGDLAAFHAQAAATPKPDGCWIFLFDGDMNQRVTSAWPWGTLVPVADEKSLATVRQEAREAP